MCAQSWGQAARPTSGGLTKFCACYALHCKETGAPPNEAQGTSLLALPQVPGGQQESAAVRVPKGSKWSSFSGPQKGPAERGHVKKRQKSSKSVKNIFDTFRHFSRRAKNVKNRQKVSNMFSTLFDNFRAAPVFRPLWGALNHGQILAVWILAAKLPNSDLNFAVDCWVDVCLLFFSKERRPQNRNPLKNIPANSPGNLFRNFPSDFCSSL